MTKEPDLTRQMRIWALVVFLFVVLFCYLTTVWQDHQNEGLRRAQRASYGNCVALQTVIQQGVDNLKVNTTLPAKQRSDSLATYETLLSQFDCADIKP